MPTPPAGGQARASVRARNIAALSGTSRDWVVATVSTTLPRGQLRATVAWGDGTFSHAVLAGRQLLSVTARHAWRRAGRYIVKVLLTGSRGQVLARATCRAMVSARG